MISATADTSAPGDTPSAKRRLRRGDQRHNGGVPTVYHLRPEPMVGDTLWPLSDLAVISAPAYLEAIGRYDDRPRLVERPVEPLGCRWCDCVFLCPVHPQQLRDAVLKGRPETPGHDWLVLDADRLEPARTVLYRPTGYRSGSHPPPVSSDHCEPLTPAALRAASTATQATLARLANPAKRLVLFADVVHVLYRGPIQVDPGRTIRA